jgi:ribonuclease D
MPSERSNSSLPKQKISRKQSGYVWVETNQELCRIAVSLEKEPVIGVDLEADSMFHYKEKVCLLQISTPSQNILVDPLGLKDIAPLKPVFADPHVRKVIHGSDYDIRSLKRDFGIEVRSLFDTHISARFLGYRETGLANLLKDKFGLNIEKKYQKKDWSKRPLPNGMLDYAVQDASCLLPLARILEKELRAKNRILWVEEECEIQSRVSPATNDKKPLFLKFKGAGRLDSRSLAVLEAILQFRNKLARRRDLPPFKVLANGPIMGIVTKRPMTEADIKEIKGLSTRQVKALGPSLLKKMGEALDLPREELPVYPKKAGKRISLKAAERTKALRKWREKRAGEMVLEPGLVCSNAQIQSLALVNPMKSEDLEFVNGLRNWQRQVFGSEICELLKKTG